MPGIRGQRNKNSHNYARKWFFSKNSKWHNIQLNVGFGSKTFHSYLLETVTECLIYSKRKHYSENKSYLELPFAVLFKYQCNHKFYYSLFIKLKSVVKHLYVVI